MRFAPLTRTLVILLLALVGLQGGSCGTPELCTGEIGKETIDPNKGICQKNCECSNQSYTGYCELDKGKTTGHCVSQKRESCPSPGALQPCTPLLTSQCKLGTQTCQAPGLQSAVWGDCKCSELPPGQYAERCGKNGSCTKGLKCVISNAEKNRGFCTISCTNSCPMYTAQGGAKKIPTCQKIAGANANEKHCLFLCKVDDDCPKGFGCNAKLGVCD